MTKLCNKFCPDDFRAEMSRLKWERLSPASLGAPEPQEEKQYEEEGEGKEEDEEEEEEEEEE